MNDVINQLKQQIRAIETENRSEQGAVVHHGCPALDRLLPQGGYPRGSLVQWITVGGQGASYLSLRVAAEACRDGGALVVVDPQREFYPPAAAAMGIALEQVIVLQTTDWQDQLWATEQALRCPSVAAVWGWFDVIDDRWFRRLQLSAECSGCLGLLLQPLSAVRAPSWAEVQWLVGVSRKREIGNDNVPNSANLSGSPRLHGVPAPPMTLPTSMTDDSVSSTMACQPISLQLTRCRGTATGKSIELIVDPVSGKISPDTRQHLSHKPEKLYQPAVPLHVA